MALGRISGGKSKGRENLNYGSGPPGRLPNRATATPQPSPNDPGYWFQGPLPQTPGGNIDWRAVNAPVNMPMADQQRSQADYRAERMVDKYNRIFSDPVALERAMNYSRANPRYGGLAGAQMFQDLGAEGFGNYVRDKFLNIKAGANARTNYMPGEGYNPQYTPYTPEVEAWLAQNPRENFMEGGSAWSAPTGPWRPPGPTQEQIDNAPRPRSNGPYPGDPGSSYGGGQAAFGGGAAPFAAAQALGGGRASPGGAAPMGGLSSDIMRKLQMGMPPHLLGLPPGATAAAGRGLPGGATPTYPTGPVPRTPLPGTNPQPYPAPTPGAPHPGYGPPFQPGMYAGPMPTNWDIGMQAFGYRPLGGPMMGGPMMGGPTMGGYNAYGGSAFR